MSLSHENKENDRNSNIFLAIKIGNTKYFIRFLCVSVNTHCFPTGLYAKDFREVC